MTEILVVGSLNTDLVVRTARFPAPGETISGEDLQIFPGGKGANQAVAAARQGASVAMLGRVGKDNFGDFLLDNLKMNHVDTRLIQRDDAATGAAVIMVDTNGQNSIILSPGANGKVSPADVETVSFADVKLALFQLEIPLETVLRAAITAKKNGARVLLNPAPARSLPDELIAQADFILPNETELSQLTNLSVKDIHSAETAARALLAKGAQTVIVTLGANGALIVNKHQATHVPTFKVNPVDTTAAGDAFIGGFASALLRGLKLEEAVRYANACGGLAATKLGAQPSLPTKEDVEKFIA
ncbi:MAG TPA: ribokinase [Anaerolineales bacterium]|nr:ribokinase [Anaerolineales bacterium]